MDRQSFLSQLLNVKNVVQAAEGEDCIICREPYVALGSETGPVEKQIRLPCDAKHTVGSNCITMWLQEHNTCPICRHPLFPNPPTRNDEEDDEDDEDGWSDVSEDQDIGVGLPEMKYLCQVLCNNLGFDASQNHPVRDIAIQVAQRVWYTDIVQAEPSYAENFHLAAACVYMASFLVCRRLRIRDILRVSPLIRDGIVNAYERLDGELDEILDEELCRRVGTVDMEEVLRRLPKMREYVVVGQVRADEV